MINRVDNPVPDDVSPKTNVLSANKPALEDEEIEGRTLKNGVEDTFPARNPIFDIGIFRGTRVPRSETVQNSRDDVTVPGKAPTAPGMDTVSATIEEVISNFILAA